MRRNNVPMGRRQQDGGPLMTNHLKNIDLELELLKRKRQMIEQQQMMMMDQNMSSSRQYNFDYDSMVYEDRKPRGSNNDIPVYHNNQFGIKREADPHWNHEYPPKKKGAKRGRGNQSNYNNRMESKSRYDSPSFSGRSYSPKSGPNSNNKGPRRPPPSVKGSPKNFKPQTSLSAKPSTKRNVSYQQQRKSSAPVATKTYKGVENILLPDKTPTPQVTGRLELALGSILKDVREKYGATPVHLHRSMKQTIRERIRAVMLGKVVGNAQEILEHYREEFPPDTDIDIINIAKEADKKRPVERFETLAEAKPDTSGTGPPEEQLKKKVIKLLDATLREMFTKIEDVYAKESENTEKDTKDDNETTEVAKQSSEETQPENPNAMEKELSDNFEALYKIISPHDLKRLMPRIIKKYVPLIIKFLCMNTKFVSERENIVAEMKIKIAEWKKSEAEANEQKLAQQRAQLREQRQRAVDLPYNVKVMGLPSLPKKVSMQTFLDQFNPKSIKKHKNIHNLLFVAFSDKTDFTNILAANGTKIGRLVISVKESDKFPRGNANTSNNTSVQDDMNDYADPNDSELDTKIHDLLTSIRKAEDETANNAEELNAVEKEGITEDGSENVTDNLDSKESGNIIETENIDLTNETEDKDDFIEDITNDDNETETLQPTDVERTEPMDSIETEIKESNEVTETDDTEPMNGSSNTNINEEQNNEESQKIDEEVEKTIEGDEKNDAVDELVTAKGRATPSRTSTRLASVTPSTIRTRRASRLAQNSD